MMLSHLVIDDFLNNPDDIREKALNMDYVPNPKAYNFPGRNSVQRLMLDGLTRRVIDLVNEPLVPAQGTAHGKFRATFAGDEGKANVHIDNAYWSGILFLSKPEHCQGGTDFFRHRETNTERAPIYPEDLEKMGMKTYDEFWQKTISTQTNDPSKWEHTLRLPMRYNRLILFRPWLYHNAGPSFGDSMKNCRLVYLLFFRNK